MPPDACHKPTRSDVEGAIMDAGGDARVLAIVLNEAGESPRHDGDATGPVLMVPKDTFLAWQRMCNHVVDSVREVECRFYEAGL